MKKVYFAIFLFVINTYIFSQNINTHQIYFIVDSKLWQDMDIGNSANTWNIEGERNFSLKNYNNQYLWCYNKNKGPTIYSLKFRQIFDDTIVYEIIEIVTYEEYVEREKAFFITRVNGNIEEWIESGKINNCEIYKGMIFLRAKYISVEERLLRLIESREIMPIEEKLKLLRSE